MNGIWMSGHIADREIVIINLIVAAITAGVAVFFAGIVTAWLPAMVLLYGVS